MAYDIRTDTIVVSDANRLANCAQVDAQVIGAIDQLFAGIHSIWHQCFPDVELPVRTDAPLDASLVDNYEIHVDTGTHLAFKYCSHMRMNVNAVAGFPYAMLPALCDHLSQFANALNIRLSGQAVEGPHEQREVDTAGAH
ncbi:unnamed protein product [Oppiella nova]|uniref:Uncharacterized protein n=1 Tax=Oppiella nova TaxID=334625 RepID=A0A7R9LN84_9ACAR|nr:unnamed protein product [Oppiella nova]CAG2164941.1 unnamed protein product [Oppiella nova]